MALLLPSEHLCHSIELSSEKLNESLDSIIILYQNVFLGGIIVHNLKRARS